MKGNIRGKKSLYLLWPNKVKLVDDDEFRKKQ